MKSVAKSNLKFIGNMGEREVAAYLQTKSLVILDKNWRIKGGELDLICEEAGTIVFVEVKTRTSNIYGTPFDAITPEKAFRLQRLALAWMAMNHRWGQEYRIDVVGVWMDGEGACEIEHRKGVL
jgi:putative endonuclease